MADTCQNCHTNSIPKGNRKYCAACSARASAIWKKQMRAQWRAAWERDGRRGRDPALDDWASAEARRAYYREYMRRYRARKARETNPCLFEHEGA